MKQQVRIKDIAIEARVSPATVSRALRSHPSIPLNTRTKILRIARKLGYRPNPMLGALMTQIRNRKPGASPNLACLHGDPPAPDLRLTQDEFLKGVQSSSRQLGYHTDLFDWNGVEKPDSLVHVLRARNIQGIILTNIRPKTTKTNSELSFPWDEFAWVVIGHNEGIPQLHRVGNEIYQIVKLALQEATKRGYRRPGLAMPLSGPNRAGLRWPAAFLGNLMAASGKTSLKAVFRGDWNLERFLEWFESYKPDVVLSLADQPRRWLAQMNRRVPEDVGFIHLAANISDAKVSGVEQSFIQCGEAAVHTLDSTLRRNERGIPERRRR